MKPGGTKMEPGDAKPQAKILIVEDVANVATVLQARLESYNYQVCDIVQSGPQAIASAMANQPDLVLMDILLDGDMNGIEAAEQISRQMDVPIIFLSCLNDQQVLEHAIQTKPYGFILKPYDNAELKFNIENALNRHKDNKAQAKLLDELKKEQIPGQPE